MPIAENLQEIVRKAGGPLKLATALGIKPPSIYNWRRVPYRFVKRVSEITGLDVKSIPTEDMPPDV